MPTCAFLPTPPLNLLKGTICFFSVTSVRYLIAFLRCIPLMAMAVSRVFLKCTLSSTPRALHAGSIQSGYYTHGLEAPCFFLYDLHLAAFSGSVEYLPMVYPTWTKRERMKCTMSEWWKAVSICSYKIEEDTHPYLHHMDDGSWREKEECACAMAYARGLW